MNKSKETAYMLMAFTGNAIFGFSFLFSKVALNIAKPFILLAFRFTVAVIVMSLLIVFKVIPVNFKGKDLKPLLLLGVIQPVIYFICESYGIKLTSSSFAGVIIALIPIAGMIASAIFLKEKPTLLQVIFSILSVSGVIVMTIVDSTMSVNYLGLLLLLGAVFASSGFSIISRSISDKFTAFERTFIMFIIGSLFFDTVAIVTTTDINDWLIPLTTPSFWLAIVYLSCLSSIGAFVLLNKVLDVLDVTRSLVFANVTTVISVLAGVLILHEQFSLVQFIGIIMALSGVYGVNRFTK